MNILSAFVVVLLVMLVVVFLIPEEKKNAIRWTMAAGGFVLLGMAIYLVKDFLAWREIDKVSQFYNAGLEPITWYEGVINITYAVGVDGVSVAMIMLSAIVVITGVFASFAVEDKAKEYFLWFIMLSIGVFGFFISIDLFTMFLFYEVALIPMYLLIGVWGSGNKEYAAMKLTLMLMGGSAFLMVGIFGIYYFSSVDGDLTFNLVKIAENAAMPVEWQRIFFPLTFVGFGVLGAMFPFHTWSPDGHASAPTAVSMLHAGVLMKLGGYGCFRVAMTLMPEACKEQAWIFIVLTGISVVYGAFSACVQNDLKYINAYSSVSHCGLVLFALLMMNQTAMTGAIMQMLSHGLMTALFFALIGMIYGQTHTRDIRYLGGLMQVMPFLCVCYVIAGMASLGLPGLSGFVAEMTIFVGSFEHEDLFHRFFVIGGCTSIVITAVYILRVVGKILFGPLYKIENKDGKFYYLSEHHGEVHHYPLRDAIWYEKIATIGLIVSIAIIGMYPLWISDMISSSLASIAELLK